ncbi:hypothetical protein TWF696_009922 [Orbilia brochopaga]|uniref:CRESS-DNA virus Rep endonuclease domain-containing protein n=1 Tax=Orbilia brochopaga TaxID=3140254 RepID=A0AAV9U3H4_9PEZI
MSSTNSPTSGQPNQIYYPIPQISSPIPIEGRNSENPIVIEDSDPKSPLIPATPLFYYAESDIPSSALDWAYEDSDGEIREITPDKGWEDLGPERQVTPCPIRSSSQDGERRVPSFGRSGDDPIMCPSSMFRATGRPRQTHSPLSSGTSSRSSGSTRTSRSLQSILQIRGASSTGRIQKKKKTKKGKGEFRFQGRTVFLTWDHVTRLSDDEFHTEVKKFDFSRYKLVREFHADGDPHFHCLAILQKKIDITNPRHYDIKGYHADIRPVRDFEKSNKYLSKEGSTFIGGEEDLCSKKEQTKRLWAEGWALQTSTERLAHIQQHFPKEGIVHFTNISKWASSAEEEKEKMPYQPKYDTWRVRLNPEICDWLEKNMYEKPGKQDPCPNTMKLPPG